MRRILALVPLLVILTVGCASQNGVRLSDDGSNADRSAGTAEETRLYSSRAIDHVISGAFFESQGRYNDAIHEYNQALLYDETSISIYRSIAENYQRLGLLESAELIIQRGLIAAGDDQEMLRFLGELEFQLQKYEEAFETFNHLTTLYPDDTDGWYNLAALHIRFDQEREAVECYNRIQELNGPNLDLLVRQATLLTLSGDREGAIEIYEQMETLRPDDYLIPFTMAGLFLETGDTLTADSAFARSLSLNPDEPRIWQIRIQIAAINNDTLKTLDLTGSALHYLPESSEIHSLAAAIYSQYDLYHAAEQTLLNAIQIDSTGLGHYMNLGYLYHELERWDDAEEIYRIGLEIDPEEPGLLNNFAYMLAERRDESRYQEALELVNRALELEPESATYLDTKGWLLYLLDRVEEAREYLEQAALLDTLNPEILDHLGDLYFRLGNMDRARTMWSRAIEQGGDEESIRAKLSQ